MLADTVSFVSFCSEIPAINQSLRNANSLNSIYFILKHAMEFQRENKRSFRLKI